MSIPSIDTQHRAQQIDPTIEPTTAPSREPSNTASARLMPEPEYVSVSGTIELLKMMLEVSRSDRKAMKEMKQGIDKAATAAESSQLEEMRADADEKLAAALFEGAFKFGAASLSAASSTVSVRSSMLGDSSKALKASLDRTATKLKFGAEAMSALAGPVGGSITHSASMHGVNAKAEEHKANALRRSSDAIKSDIDDIRQHDSKMFDLVREIESAMNRCTQIALQSR